ncbi:MAG TPA: hypothetical protein VJH65_01870 [Candidatus Nanoarchaeia archaeon]|nr:hypothetical protein [Candidatus Nanoarchaeia archaeon]
MPIEDLSGLNLGPKVLEDIEKGLKLNHVGGVIIIKKGIVDDRTKALVEGIENYLRDVGYDSFIKSDKDKYFIEILNPF